MNLFRYFANLVARDRPQQYRSYIGTRQAGMRVDEDAALNHAAVWACVRIISESIAALPWRAHRRTGAGSEIMSGDLDYLLHVEANPETSALDFRQTCLAHTLLWGNAYAEIVRNGRGEPIEVWQLAPDKWNPDRTQDGKIWYVTDGQPVLERENCFHLRGLGFDGLVGYSVIRHAARSVGLGLALDQMAASTFKNGAAPGIIISQKEGKTLSPEGQEALLNSWRHTFQGPENANKVGYVDAGMEVSPLTLPLNDMQFLESRKFQVAEVARWFRVPPHKLADLERATFSNIEHLSLEFVTDTLVPWAARLEAEAQVKLIGRNNRYSGNVYTKINMAGLLRGDMKSRMEAYAIGRQWGWLSANDVRALEDMNEVEGGDDYLVPMNMTPVDMLREAAGEPTTDPTQDPAPLSGDLQATPGTVAAFLRKRETV